MRPARCLLFLPLCACLLVGGLPLARRIAFDSANAKILLAVDGGELSDVCRAVGRPVAGAMDELRAIGVNGMATTTCTPVDLASLGELSMQPAGPSVPATRLRLLRAQDDFDVARRLGRLFQVDVAGPDLVVHAAGGALSDLRIFSSGQIEHDAQVRGFTLLRRVPNLPTVGRAYYDLIADSIPQGSWVLFDGKEALGYPAALGEVGQRLAGRHLRICNVEFAGQLGAREVTVAAGGEAVLLHSVTVGEMARLPLSTLFPRWVRAASERGVRAFLVRFFPNTNIPYAGQDILSANLRYVKEVAQVLASAGYTPGPVLGPQDLWGVHGAALPSAVVWASRLASSVAVAILLALLALAGGLLTWRVSLWGALPIAVLLAASYSRAPTLTAQLAALAIAVLSATLATIVFDLGVERPGGEASGTRRAAVIGAALVETAALSILGGLLVSMTLSQAVFVFRLEDFRGVKAVYMVPPLLAAGFHLWRRRIDPLDIPVRIRHVVVGLVVLAAGALYVLRSGNFVSVGSPLMAEYAVRDQIEEMGLVRPRTKEFLVGYPFLVAAGAAAACGDAAWRPLFLLAGSVAPVSVVNSFCHVHTPPLLSVVRALTAILPGILVGLVVAWLYVVFVAPRPRRTLAVHGYFGFGNLGDELILDAFAGLARAHLPGDVELVVFSHTPGQRPATEGRREVCRTSPLAYVRELWHAQALVSLGGGLFQDRRGPLTALFYLFPVVLARLLGLRRIVVCCQSVSSLERPWLRALVARVLANADLIVVRDGPSAANLRGWGLPEESRLVVGSDLVVAAGPPPGSNPPQARTRPQTIGLNLRPVPGMPVATHSGIMESVTRVAGRTHHGLILLSMQPAEDTDHLRSLASASGGSAPGVSTVSAGDWETTMGQVGVLVAMRYHGLLLGMASGIPTLVLAYDEKVRDLFMTEGYPHVVDVQTAADPAHAVEEALGRLLSGANEAAQAGRSLLAALHSRGHPAALLAVAVLGEAFGQPDPGARAC